MTILAAAHAAPTDGALAIRVLVGFGLAYLLGFERELRGSPAGDRTFALIGAAATLVTAVAFASSPQAVAGVLTGIGFIGAGIVFQGEHGSVRGVTTAATLFVAASTGIVVGSGHVLLGVLATALTLLVLEIRHLPLLKYLDARRYEAKFASDTVATSGPGEHLLES